MQQRTTIVAQALELGPWIRMMAAPFVRRNRARRGFPSMIGLVLVTHGRLAVEFRAALEHVVGPQTQIESVTIGPDDDVEQRRKDIIEAVKRVDTGDGVAILTDMFGGTPSNLAISCMGRPNVEVLAGINMPMLVKLAKIRGECPLEEAVAAATTVPARAQIRHHRQPRARRKMSGAEDLDGDLPEPVESPPTLSSGHWPSSTRRACTPAPRRSSVRRWSGSMPRSASPAARKPSAARRSWG